MGSLATRMDPGECVTADADLAVRREFLTTIGKLPHVERGPSRDLGLEHTVEAEIIPRLMLAHREKAAPRSSRQRHGVMVTAGELDQFGRIIQSDVEEDAIAFIGMLGSRGTTVENILLDLLAPTARKLGEMWESDDIDFVSVTIALSRLQTILRLLSGKGVAVETTSEARVPTVLLAPTPGEQHVFSVLLVDHFFRLDGWDVWTMPGATTEELVDLVDRESFEVAGLSLSCEIWLGELAKSIAGIRSASRNKAIVIMVGGPLFVQRPELVREIGADATAQDGRAAVAAARRATQAVRA